jgi:hypothetical protein
MTAEERIAALEARVLGLQAIVGVLLRIVEERLAVEAAGILRDYRRKQRFQPAHERRSGKIRAAMGRRRKATG